MSFEAPSGLSPYTPPPRPAANTAPAATAAAAAPHAARALAAAAPTGPAAAAGLAALHAATRDTDRFDTVRTAPPLPTAPRLTAGRRPPPPPENLARRSLRAAAEARRSLHRSMRAAAVEASRLSWGAWCWIKFKTQWQFWIILAAAMTGWWFLAQRPALRALHEAHAAYDAKYQQVSNLQDERNRLREIYEPLRRGDPYAWQMLARHQLGWQQESEVISVPHPTENPAGYKADSLRR